MSLASGATFAGYTVVRPLGRGPAGEVYLVDHPRLSRRCALKILFESLSADDEFRERFVRESSAVTTLYHPNVVEVHDRGEFGGRLWIVMDYVDGVNVAQLIAEQFPAGMPAGQALAIAAAIADALDYAHHRGLLHRNVKPANILLTHPSSGERQILLSDFGIARKLGGALARQLGGSSSSAPTSLTLAAVTYTAPEQLMGAGDARADQYALAATVFELLTGAPPFTGDNPVAVIGQHLTAAPPKLSDWCADLQRLDEVMFTALAKEPADRFGGCRKFADALARRAGVAAGNLSPEAVLTVARTVPRNAVGSTASERPKRRGITAVFATHRRLWITFGSAAAICTVLAVLLLAVGIMRGRDRNAPSTADSARRPGVPASTTASVSHTLDEPLPLNGTYRVEVNRSHQTYNDMFRPQPPDVVTWWAFRSACLPTGCVATGIMLDGSHQAAAPDSAALSLDFVEGHWESRPQTLRFGCVDPDGRGDEQTITQVLSLRPTDRALLRGELSANVGTNECGQQGAVIRVPTVVAQVGEVPSSIDLPDPGASSTITAPR